MTLEDGFKMLKKPDRLNPDPKQRMYFWYGHEQALLLDKTKVSVADIKTALASKPPKPPFCYGRLALHDGKQGGQEIRVAVAGAIPSKLAKDLKAEAAKHGLRGVDVVVDDGLDEEGEAVADDAADVASNANRLKLAEAVKGLLAKRPQLRDAVTTWIETHDKTEAMSSDDVAKAIDELSKLEFAEGDDAQDRAVKIDKLAQAVESELAALRSGKGKPNAALAEPKLQPLLNDGSERIGASAETAKSLRAKTEELKSAESSVKGLDEKSATALRRSRETSQEAGSVAKAIEDSRQSLHAALVRLGRAIKDRDAASSTV